MQKGHAFVCHRSVRGGLNGHIYTNKKLRISAISSCALLLMFVLLAIFPVASSFSGADAASVVSETTLAMSTEDIAMEFGVESPEGTFNSTSSTVSVTSNNYSGYTLSIAAEESTNLSDGKGNTIPTISSAVTEQDFSTSSTYNNKWGYKPSQYVDTNNENTIVANTSYLPGPSTTGTILDITSGANVEANTYQIGLGARVDYDTAAGTYKTDVVFAAVSNAITYSIYYDENTEDDVENMPAENPQAVTVAGSTSPSTTTLSNNTPVRAGHIFAGWCDEATTLDQVGNQVCGGNTFAVGATFGIDQTSDGSNTVIYAIWELESYTLTLDQNGATTNGSTSATVLYNNDTLSSITVPQRTYTVSGFTASGNASDAIISSTSSLTSTYTFDGWYKGARSKKKIASGDATPELEASTAYTNADGEWINEGAVTLYAGWADGEVTLPTIEKTGYNCGWTTDNNASYYEFDSGESIAPESNMTMYGVCNQSLLINYDGNGLYFNNDATNTVNKVHYNATSSVARQNITKYSHTANINDAGTQSGNYANSLNTNEIVTIDGATSLHVKLTYSSDSVSYDWVSFWSGSHSDYTASANYSTGVKCGSNTTGKYGGYTKTTVECDVTGDTLTFGFVSNSYSNGYGYYAVITGEGDVTTYDKEAINGEYAAPGALEGPYQFLGWSEDPNATTPTYTTETEIKEGIAKVNLDPSVTLYAVYEKGLTISFNNNGGSGVMANQVIYTHNPANLSAMSFTAPNGKPYFYRWNTKTNEKGVHYIDGERIEVPADTEIGDSITLYAIWVNPPALQNLPDSSCTAKPSVAIDNRDNRLYTIQRLDGECWIMENLALDPVNVPLATLKGNTNASDTSLEYLKGVNTRDASLDPTGQYPTEPVMTWDTSKNVSTVPLVHSSGKDTVSGKGDGVGNYTSGAYYNPCSFSAGSYCYNSTERDGYVVEDICPAGWRVPTSNEYMGGDSLVSRISLSSPLAGDLRRNSSSGTFIVVVGVSGYYWMSDWSDGEGHRYISYNSNGGFNFTTSWASPPPTVPSNGMPIRCVRKYNKGVVLNQNGATTDGTASTTVMYGASTLGPIVKPTKEGTYYGSGFTTPSENRADGAAVSSTNTIEYGATLAGWYKEPETINKIAGDSTTPELEPGTSYTDAKGKWINTARSNITLYAGWMGTSVTLPTITKQNHVCGWTEVASGATTITYNSGDTVNLPGRDTALYGVCVPVMQNVPSNLCDSNPSVMLDNRDNQLYNVQRLEDGNCWMLDNLAIDLVNTPLATLKGKTNASDTTLEYLKGVRTGTTADEYATAGVAVWGSANKFDMPLVNMDIKNTVPSGAPSGNGNNKVGGYYNYCAASAGSYCYGNGTSSGRPSGEATEDICPAGWRMPTGGSNGEYSVLYDAYNSNATDFINALSVPLSGNFAVDSYGNASANQLGSYGYFWSVTKPSGTGVSSMSGRSTLMRQGSSINTDRYGYSGDYRYNGKSVRCLLNFNTPITLNQNGASTEGSTSTTVSFGDKNLGAITKPEKNIELYASGFTTPSENQADGASVSSSNTIQFSATLSGWYKEAEAVNKIADVSTTPLLEMNTEYVDENGKWSNTSHSAITLYAGWMGSSITLPTITKQNYVCGWTETATGAKSFTYGSGATVNLPGRDITLYGVCVMVMQNLSSSSCSNDLSMVIDNRDNQIYAVKRLEDGNCWMLDNLAIDLVNTSLATLKGNTNASDTTLEYLKGVRTGTTADRYADAGVSSDWDSSFTSTYNKPKANVDNRDEMLSGKRIGGYYNFCAASAGSYCYGNGTSSAGSPSGDSTEDICPAGWRMPIGGDNGEYNDLFTDYFLDVDLFKNALSVTLPGFYSTISFSNKGSMGRMWSSTLYGNNSMHVMEAVANDIRPRSWDSRVDGLSVRCLLNYEMTINLDQNGATRDGSASTTVAYGEDRLGQITAPEKDGNNTVSGFTTPVENNASGAIVSSMNQIQYNTTFAGWYETSGVDNRIADNSATPVLDSNTTYTDSVGKWNRAARTSITLYAGWMGESITLPTISKSGYECGWTETAAGATSITYGSGETVNLPARNVTLYGVCAVPMQNMSASVCTINPTIAIDNRDGQSYIVQRLDDGNCWMLDNLAIDLVDVPLATMKGNTNASDTSLEYLKNGGGNGSASRYAREGVQKVPLDEKTKDLTSPLIWMDKKDEVPADAPSGNGKNKTGGFYNYCAASAGSYCYNDSGMTNGRTWDNSYEDICPAGWRMPTGSYMGENVPLYGEYVSLHYYYYLQDYETADLNYRNALSVPYSGYMEAVSNRWTSNAAVIWASTIFGGYKMYSPSFSSSEVISSDGIGRDSAVSMRCILDYNVPVTLDKNDNSAIAGTTSVDIKYGANTLGNVVAPAKNDAYSVSGFTAPAGNYADGAVVSNTNTISYGVGITGWYKEADAINKIATDGSSPVFETDTSYTDGSGRWGLAKNSGVTLYAGWDTTTVTLPTITKTGYVCGWSETASGATFITYGSGATVHLPAHNTVLYGVCAVPMQDIPSSSCTTTAIPVYDTRDNKTYTIQRLGDNNCWLLDNLAIDLVNTSLSTLKGKTNASDGTLEYLKGERIGTNTDQYPITGVSGPVSGYAYYDRPNVIMTGADEIPRDNLPSGNGSNKKGALYNYCAASAGSYCYTSNSGITTGDISEDICPAGWRMPTGGASGEYSSLFSIYNSNSTDFANALSIVYTSRNNSNYVYHWTSTRVTNLSYSPALYRYNANNFNPAYNNSRNSDASVRCVLK